VVCTLLPSGNSTLRLSLASHWNCPRYIALSRWLFQKGAYSGFGCPGPFFLSILRIHFELPEASSISTEFVCSDFTSTLNSKP
jgi:hypothetical protein